MEGKEEIHAQWYEIANRITHAFTATREGDLEHVYSKTKHPRLTKNVAPGVTKKTTV